MSPLVLTAYSALYCQAANRSSQGHLFKHIDSVDELCFTPVSWEEFPQGHKKEPQSVLGYWVTCRDVLHSRLSAGGLHTVASCWQKWIYVFQGEEQQLQHPARSGKSAPQFFTLTAEVGSNEVQISRFLRYLYFTWVLFFSVLPALYICRTSFLL